MKKQRDPGKSIKKGGKMRYDAIWKNNFKKPSWQALFICSQYTVGQLWTAYGMCNMAVSAFKKNRKTMENSVLEM